MNELQMVQQITHPKIVKIFELFHDHDKYYIVSEFMPHGELFEFAK